MLHSKLNKIEEWSLYCFMIFCYWKVNDIKGPAVLASQIHRFIISLLQILLFYIISALKERKTRKRKTNMATEKIDMTDLFDKLVTTYKQTHVSVNGQQAQIECSRLWREINNGKENATTEFKAQKLVSTFISGNKPSLSSDVENVIEVSPPSSSPLQQATTPTDAVPSSSL